MKILLFWDVNLSKNLSKFIPKNVISSSLTLVQSSLTSLRAASHVIEMIASFFKLPLSVPSWHTGRLWLLRLGYYKLTRRKQKAAGWIWIIDHTIQWGIEKCFVIWELRQRDVPVAETILNHEDVEPIAMFPVTSSNGEIVYQQLEEAIRDCHIDLTQIEVVILLQTCDGIHVRHDHLHFH